MRDDGRGKREEETGKRGEGRVRMEGGCRLDEGFDVDGLLYGDWMAEMTLEPLRAISK